MNFRGRLCHRNCRNAIRSFQRLIKDNTQAKAQADKDFIQNLDRWRGRIRPLIVPDGAPRTAAHRQIAKDQVDTETKFKTKETIQEWSRMSLTRYVSWKCFWDRLSPTAAEQAFYEELEAGDDSDGDAIDSDGEPTIKVKLNKLYREVTGSSEIATTSSALARCVKKRPHDDDDAGDDDNDAPRRDSAYSTPPPKAKAKRDAGPPSTQRVGDSPALSVRQVDLLKARTALAADVKKALGDMNSRKSVYSVFKKKVENLDPDMKDSLAGDPTEVLTKLESELLAPLKALDVAMAKLPVAAVQEKKATSPPPHTSLAQGLQIAGPIGHCAF